MILCGTSPGATWRGTLAVLALSLCALPLLPTLAHAQTKEGQAEPEARRATLRAQVDTEIDAQKAQAELEKARAELAQLQAALQATQQRLKALEAHPPEKTARLFTGDFTLEGLSFKVEPEAKKPGENVIVLRKVGDKWEVVQPPAKQPVKQAEGRVFRIETKDGVLRLLPDNPPGIQLKVVPEERRSQPPAVDQAPEKRLDNLERRLQQILKELETLRKETKPQKQGATAVPSPEGGLRLRIGDSERSPNPTPKPQEK